MALAALLSFRLGGADGVSVEAAKWALLLRDLGWDVRTVAGAGPADAYVSGLDFHDAEVPSEAAVRAAVEDCDVVVVENLLSLPLKLSASRVVARVLRDRPAILRHFDLAWQRERFAANDELPPVDSRWRHVVVNRLSQQQLAQRGIAATLLPLGFPTPAAGRRREMRAAMGLGEAEVLQLQPTRAIARKGLPDAIAFAEGLGAVLWITGPTEEGYEETLATLLRAAKGRVIRGWPDAEPEPPWTMDDAYAACDLVSFPSRWEGFGLPMIEAALHRKALVARMFPVAREFAEAGLRWIDIDGPDPVARAREALDPAARDSTAAWLDHNVGVATTRYSDAAARDRLGDLLASMRLGSP